MSQLNQLGLLTPYLNQVSSLKTCPNLLSSALSMLLFHLPVSETFALSLATISVPIKMKFLFKVYAKNSCIIDDICLVHQSRHGIGFFVY